MTTTQAPAISIAEARARYDALTAKMLAPGRALLALVPEAIEVQAATRDAIAAEVEAVFAPLRAAGKMDEAIDAENEVRRAAGEIDMIVVGAWIEEIIERFEGDVPADEVESSLPNVADIIARLGDEDPVTEEDVVVVSEAYEGDPLGDLANGTWHPSTGASVAWALSMLAQEIERRPASA